MAQQRGSSQRSVPGLEKAETEQEKSHKLKEKLSWGRKTSTGQEGQMERRRSREMQTHGGSWWYSHLSPPSSPEFPATAWEPVFPPLPSPPLSIICHSEGSNCSGVCVITFSYRNFAAPHSSKRLAQVTERVSAFCYLIVHSLTTYLLDYCTTSHTNIMSAFWQHNNKNETQIH